MTEKAADMSTSTETTRGFRKTFQGLVISDKMASRMHARIERRRDKFVLVDQSSNGTYLTVDGDREILLRREEQILRGTGRITFGHTSQTGTGDVISFVCVEGFAPAS